MNTSLITTILIVVAVIVYLIYKQCSQQPISQRDFLLPAAAFIYFLVNFSHTPDWNMAVMVLVGSVIGIATGFVGGQVVRVWRDQNSGFLYQRGGWSYILILVALLVLRVAIYIGLRIAHVDMDFQLLNDAFIAMAIANYLGRSINVHLRALNLTQKAMGIYR
ncbi:MAG TPA: CcdC protein domain-containing protein [Ktedonobacteraceae bacterium]|jgi:membrane protein CcdC involved in cytochrome C biogenesis|nr:CcdC protein domain-containing protein [Ktedonobacteraceae bacterium]